MATDEQIVGASREITLSNVKMEVYPLSDKDLVSLTMWCRFKIGQDAREQAEFAAGLRESEEIKREAFNRAQEVEWFTPVGIGLLLNDEMGLVEVAFRMCKKNWKKESFYGKFGQKSEITKENLANRKEIQDTFLAQNTVQSDLDEEDPPTKGQKKD